MKPVLHQSQLSTWDRCPMQYYWRYCENRTIPPGVAALRGTATHVSSAKDLQSKRDHGQLLLDDEVTDIARDTVVDSWMNHGVRLCEEEQREGEKQLLASTIDTAVSLAATHHKQLAPALEPVHIERPWKLEVKDYPVDLMGTIDIQESGVLRDLKTKSVSPTSTAADTSTQLTLYHLAATKLDKKAPEQVVLDTLVALKSGPKLVTLRSTRNMDDWQVLLDRIQRMVKAINAGIFIPCLPDNWVCCDKWCGYYADLCPFGRRKQHTKGRGK